jgi:hypothetical protein
VGGFINGSSNLVIDDYLLIEFNEFLTDLLELACSMNDDEIILVRRLSGSLPLH